MNTTNNFVTDLSASRAPLIEDTQGDNYPAYRWKTCCYGDALKVWMEDGVVPQSMLESRVADKNGEWLGPVGHDCLPDYSCCHKHLLADKFERINYVQGCHEVRSHMDRNFVLKLWMDKASVYGDDKYISSTAKRLSNPPGDQRVM